MKYIYYVVAEVPSDSGGMMRSVFEVAGDRQIEHIDDLMDVANRAFPGSHPEGSRPVVTFFTLLRIQN